jgi:hypothetical protein
MEAEEEEILHQMTAPVSNKLLSNPHNIIKNGYNS